MLYLSSNLFAVEKETILKLKKINLFNSSAVTTSDSKVQLHLKKNA